MKRWLLMGGLVLGGGAAALASIPVAGIAQAPGEPGGNFDASKLSAEETIARSQQMQAQILATEVRVGVLQKRAATKKDMVLVNCVADKLEQVHGHVAVANQAAQAIQAALSRHDDGARAHNLERQSIVHQKVLVLGTEAEGCSGEDVNYIGSTRVDVEIDPSIPNDDPTLPPASVIPPAIRPVESSAGT